MPFPLRMFICIGASACLISSIYLLRKYRYLRQHGEVTTGQILRWKKVPRKWQWQPIVEFKTNKGRKVVIQPSYIWYHLHPYLQQGQSLGVIYDPNQPQNALVISVIKVDWFALMIAFASLIALAFGVADYWILNMLRLVLPALPTHL